MIFAAKNRHLACNFFKNSYLRCCRPTYLWSKEHRCILGLLKIVPKETFALKKINF